MNTRRTARLLLLSLLVFAAACKRDVSSNKTSHCYCNSNYYHYSAGSAVVSFPTAFTPDGDGRNDVYHPVTANLAVSGFNMVIYDAAGTQVFSTTDPYTGWDGYINGTFASGKYDAEFSFTTLSGDVISSCTCFYALHYDPNLSCLQGGRSYYFEDQFDASGQALYQTTETVCP